MTDARIRLIFSGVLSLVLITATAAIYVLGRDVPDTLVAMDSTVIGFFFGHVWTNGTGAAPRNGGT